MKKIRIKSTLPIYLAALVWLAVGIFRPRALLKMGTLILTAIASAAVYLVGSKLFPGKVEEVREPVDTGDEELNRTLEEAHARLENIQAYGASITDPNVERMVKAGNSILTELEKDPKKITLVRRFLNYFLPTAEKLTGSYVQLSSLSAKGENIQSALSKIESSMPTIADAFEKQLDSLYRDQSFDIEADISVLETLLKSEGLTNTLNLKDTQTDKSQKLQTGV